MLEQYERDAAPFVLLLRTYEVAQLFGDGTGRLFGNIAFEAFESAGVGVLDVQLHDHPHSPLLYASQGSMDSTVQWPSLLLDVDQWEQAVSQIIVRADLIVVLAPVITPGLALELGALVRLGRADRTVVLVSGEDFGGPEDRSVAILKGEEIPDTSETIFDPVLLMFPRVLWVGDLDQETPLSAFVFRDLVDRIIAIVQLPDNERHAASLDRHALACIDPTPMLREYEVSRSTIGHGIAATWRLCTTGSRRGYPSTCLTSRGRSTSSWLTPTCWPCSASQTSRLTR